MMGEIDKESRSRVEGVEKRRQGGCYGIRIEGGPMGGARRGDRPICISTLAQDALRETVQYWP